MMSQKRFSVAFQKETDSTVASLRDSAQVSMGLKTSEASSRRVVNLRPLALTKNIVRPARLNAALARAKAIWRHIGDGEGSAAA